ncbi:7802_t:CDS:10 [Entrophospora sp. SA101]|nr:7802_t:CDS:10 [Entrophospora sp. SA101]
MLLLLRKRSATTTTTNSDNVIDEIRRELSSVKKREQLSLKLRDLNDNLDNNSYKQDDLNREISPIQGHIRSLHNKLERINDLKLRRAERIRSDRATTEAIEWLKNNRSSFKKHVYFPICMEIDVKDTRYADAIENAIGYNLSTFVCEDNEDYRTMTNELCDKRGLRVNIRDALQREIDLPETIKEQEISLKEKLCESARGKARVFDEYQSTLNETIEVFINRNKANLSLIQATTDLGNLGRQIQDRDDALRQATAKFNEVKKEAAHYRQESNRLINKLDDATRNELQELTQNMTLEEIEDAITDEKAKANLHHTVDPRVVDMYDERQAKIDSLRSQLETRNSTLTALNNEIAEKRQRWEPRLYELVKKISDNFSEAFDKIGCAGEVRINANEDYDKWGIDILVKFRDNEKLQPLTGQRQSGGERSVSTIMYLMALQELAKTPFRVVDEINQGMDPKNERLVHHQMVQTACRPNTSQYFLITPKLLPDLNYHKFMKVLCIYNGEWQPETMNWKKYIKERRDSA